MSSPGENSKKRRKRKRAEAAALAGGSRGGGGGGGGGGGTAAAAPSAGDANGRKRKQHEVGREGTGLQQHKKARVRTPHSKQPKPKKPWRP